jgi:hypothetical protein
MQSGMIFLGQAWFQNAGLTTMMKFLVLVFVSVNSKFLICDSSGLTLVR